MTGGRSREGVKDKGFRNPAFPFMGAALIAIFVAWLAGDGGTIFGDFPSEYSAVAIISCAIGSLFAWLGYFRSVVRAGPSGVVVLNFLGTRRISWNEIEGFRVEAQLVISLTGGTEVRCWAVQAARASLMTGRRSWVQDVIDELENMRESYRTPPGSSAPRPPS